MNDALNARWAAAIVGGLANAGVRHVVVCSGSRSTPLVLAAAANPRLKCWPVVDERSAAFFALGLAKGAGLPAAVLCTSGTAGAHFLPAVIEAAHGATPLIVLTADRPWDLQGFGAPQTTDQSRFFDRFARVELLPVPDEPSLPHLRAVIARALSSGGPVHFNVPFREPLAPDPRASIPVDDTSAPPIIHARRDPQLDQVRQALRGAERGVIVCGPREADDGFGEAVHALGAALGFPVIAEAASNARFGFHDAIAHADLLLRDVSFARSHAPQIVLRFGGGPTQKTVETWLDAGRARLFVFSDQGQVVDPSHRAEAVVLGDAVTACRHLRPESPTPSAFRESFLRGEMAARGALHALPFGEPGAARMVAESGSANLFVSSSMPIRDVDAFASPGTARMRAFANRGVNGIDGIVSTAAGVAAATGQPTLLLIGDLALMHDLHGLLIARQHELALQVVVVNNNGGGIFSFLPIAECGDHFERFFGTPHGLDFTHLAGLCGARFERPQNAATLRAALSIRDFSLIEVRTDRAANVVQHRELRARVASALEEA